MANCAVCGSSGMISRKQPPLCEHHHLMYCKWFARWSLVTGHRGPIKTTPAKIVNMLKNMDNINKVKRAKV